MNVFKMAWRNVWRSRRRSLVTIAAMTLALWVELLYAGLVRGYMDSMEQDLLDFELGDIQIFAANYLDSPSIYTTIDDPAALLAQLDALGYAASARLLGGGLAAAGELSAGVSFRGVDVTRDARVTRIGERVAQGRWIDPADPRGVVIGRRLARTLDVALGAELIVVTQAADGSLANELYTVRGVLLGIADTTDRTAIFMTAQAFRELLAFPAGAHQIIVRRPPGVDLEAAAAQVRHQTAGLTAGLSVQTWRDLMPVIASMLDSTRGLMLIVFLVVYAAVGILILNAMLMAVFERIREFGVLKALGVGPLRVLSLLLIESGIQTAIAVVVGVTLAVPGMWYLSTNGIDVGKLSGTNVMGVAMRPVWHGVYDAATCSGPLAMLVAIVLLAALYPALKAAWIRPLEAMHHR
jgi:putative ABC transport system permease protein